MSTRKLHHEWTICRYLPCLCVRMMVTDGLLQLIHLYIIIYESKLREAQKRWLVQWPFGRLSKMAAGDIVDSLPAIQTPWYSSDYLNTFRDRSILYSSISDRCGLRLWRTWPLTAQGQPIASFATPVTSSCASRQLWYHIPITHTHPTTLPTQAVHPKSIKPHQHTRLQKRTSPNLPLPGDWRRSTLAHWLGYLPKSTISRRRITSSFCELRSTLDDQSIFQIIWSLLNLAGLSSQYSSRCRDHNETW